MIYERHYFLANTWNDLQFGRIGVTQNLWNMLLSALISGVVMPIPNG